MATTKVNLYSAELDENRLHELDHANRMFARKQKPNWELKDKNFIHNKDGIIVRRSKQENSETEQSGPA